MISNTPDADRACRVILGIAVGLCLVIFGVDLAIPLGYATGVLYLVPLVVLPWSCPGWHPLALAALASVFTLLDVALGAPGAVLEVVIVNRTLSLGALWSVAGLIHLHTRNLQARQAAAAQRNRTMNAILQATPDGMLLVEQSGLIKMANQAAEHIFDYPAGGMQELPLERLVPADHQQAHRHQVASFLAQPSGRPMGPKSDVRGVQSNGRVIPLEITLGHIQDGEALTIVAVRDVSQKRRLEERLQSSQRLESIGKLAGGVAHDFNNILATIIGNGELARESLPAGSPALEDLCEILLAADRAADLTRQLLAFSRQQIIEPRNLDVNQVIQQTQKMLARLLGADVGQQLHLDPGLGTVRVDPTQLEQVLLNLSVNARDAMPKGGTLTIETSNTTLDATYAAEYPEAEPGDYIMLAVSDTGQGMSPAVQARIFEPFFTTKPIGAGTGLGLATVFGAVKQAGGHLSVYSEPGKGTTFRVYLPRVREAAEPVRPRRELARPVGGTEVLLVVEDEASLRGLLSRVLGGAGYTVLEAANGEEALLKLQAWSEKIDLLLTDVIMPQMGGIELAQRVLEQRPGTPVLYASGYTEDSITHQGNLDLQFLQKPFTPEEVLRRVRQVLDESPTAAGLSSLQAST